MKLNAASLKNKSAWEQIGVALPQFDYAAMKQNTAARPTWLHFGAGNIFRGYIARLQQELLNIGAVDTGIVVAETFDFDIIDKIYTPYDSLALLVTLNHDGTTQKEVVASMADSYRSDTGFDDLSKVFANPSLQMVSFTITEKGYSLHDMNDELLSVVASDIKNGPSEAKHAMSLLAALMLVRYNAGAYPISLVSMDNCSHNGDRLKNAVLTIAKAWAENGQAPSEFAAYIEDAAKVAFPWSMIDKITPRPAEEVEKQLTKIGIEGMSPIITGKNTFIAPFVNAEAAEYLVIEDIFPNGRPPLEHAGVYFTDRETVNKVETMKVTTCLNPLHTALAVFGCLLGYKSIAEEMKDADLPALVKKIGYDEGMKVVVDPGIINPKDFIDEVIERRLPNPFIPDAPQRIATDTSQKVGIRFGQTIKAYHADNALSTEDLEGIPLAIAAWMRYLLAVDDNHNPIELSPDPMHSVLLPQLSGIIPGKPETYNGQLESILSNDSLFGIDLYKVHLGKKIEKCFVCMLEGPGAVRAVLEKVLTERR